MSGEDHWVNQTLHLRRVRRGRDVVLGLGVVLLTLLPVCAVGHYLPEDLPVFPAILLLAVGVPVWLVLLLWLTKPLWKRPMLRLVCRPPWVDLFTPDGSRRLASFNLEEPHALLMVMRAPPSPPHSQAYPPLWVEVYLAQGGACVSWYLPWYPTIVSKPGADTLQETSAGPLKARLLRLTSLLAEPPWKQGALFWEVTWPAGKKQLYRGLPATRYETVRPENALAALPALLEALDAYAEANRLRETIARVRTHGDWTPLYHAFPKRCFV